MFTHPPVTLFVYRLRGGFCAPGYRKAALFVPVRIIAIIRFCRDFFTLIYNRPYVYILNTN